MTKNPRRTPKRKTYSDRERLNFMSKRFSSWNFITQSQGGVFDWNTPGLHKFYRSVRVMIDAAIRASKEAK